MVTWVVDPFFQYHEPFIEIDITDERYQNPGILKNFDYNTIITGSSMTENFRVSWFDDEETKTVKVPYSGAYSKDINNVFKLAFTTHNIKTVYYGIDIFQIFNVPENKTRSILPEYLYDNNIFNDVEYVFNKDIFYEYTLPNIINNEKQDNDLAYNWNNKFKFGREYVLKDYEKISPSEQLPSDYYLQNYDANIANITEYIEKYPNTKFVIFFPPYSILYYEDKIDATIATTEKVVKDLMEYKNVELYYFPNEKDIITNLDNYKDYTHYNEDINYYMYECMCKTGKHRMTKQNYEEEINKLYNIISQYDYYSI